jgi:hypothetical protein
VKGERRFKVQGSKFKVQSSRFKVKGQRSPMACGQKESHVGSLLLPFTLNLEL